MSRYKRPGLAQSNCVEQVWVQTPASSIYQYSGLEDEYNTTISAPAVTPSLLPS